MLYLVYLCEALTKSSFGAPFTKPRVPRYFRRILDNSFSILVPQLPGSIYIRSPHSLPAPIVSSASWCSAWKVQPVCLYLLEEIPYVGTGQDVSSPNHPEHPRQPDLLLDWAHSSFIPSILPSLSFIPSNIPSGEPLHIYCMYYFQRANLHTCILHKPVLLSQLQTLYGFVL